MGYNAWLKDLFAFMPLLAELGLLAEYAGPDLTSRLQDPQLRTSEGT